MQVVWLHHLRYFGVCVLAGLALTGCGQSDGLNRMEVLGSVEHQGGPLKAGSISFLPAEGLHAPAAMADVVNGEYHFTASNGPVAGTYQVVVMAAPDGKKTLLGAAVNPGRTRAAAAAPKSLPGRWEFRVEVPRKGPFQYDLRLP